MNKEGGKRGNGRRLVEKGKKKREKADNKMREKRDRRKAKKENRRKIKKTRRKKKTETTGGAEDDMRGKKR